MDINQKIERSLQLSAYASLTTIVTNFRNDGFHWAYQMSQKSGIVPDPWKEITELQLKISSELRELSDGLWPKEKTND